MSKEYTCARYWQKIVGNMDDAKGHVYYLGQKPESWERHLFGHEKELNYAIKCDIEGIFLARLLLDKARDACFWLEMELMDSGEE